MLDQTIDSMCWHIQIHLIIPLESQSAPRERILWGGFQTLSFIPRRYGGRVNRAIFIDEPDERVRTLLPPPLTNSMSEGWQSSPYSTILQDFLSRSHGEIEKLALLFAEEPPPTPSKNVSYSFDSYSISFIRRCHDSDEYSLEGFITSIYMHGSVTHIRIVPPAQSNLRTYIRWLFRGFWPASFLQRRAGEVAALFYFAMLHLITLCSLIEKWNSIPSL